VAMALAVDNSSTRWARNASEGQLTANQGSTGPYRAGWRAAW
jgi:hypothetical protein